MIAPDRASRAAGLTDLFLELLGFGDVLRLIKEVSFGFYRFLGIFMNWWDN